MTEESKLTTEEQTREILAGIVDATAKTDSQVVAVSALCLAIHFFCTASGYTHEDFIENIKQLKARSQ